MKKIISVLFLNLCLVISSAHAMDTNREPRWAVPMDLEGVPNLHKVSDDVFRSAQPSDEGLRAIETMGIKTIVNLRSFHSDRDEIEDPSMGYEQIHMKAWHPEREDIIRFLRIATDPGRTPVLVHCRHGADRTGTMCAVYRIVVQSWTKQDAIREMTQGGSDSMRSGALCRHGLAILMSRVSRKS